MSDSGVKKRKAWKVSAEDDFEEDSITTNDNNDGEVKCQQEISGGCANCPYRNKCSKYQAKQRKKSLVSIFTCGFC